METKERADVRCGAGEDLHGGDPVEGGVGGEVEDKCSMHERKEPGVGWGTAAIHEIVG